MSMYVFMTFVGCGLVTWLLRVVPFVLLKKFSLPKLAVEFLSFVPITIMAALFFESWFIGHPGHLPEINWENLIASGPTVIAAAITKNLLAIVIVGVITMAIIRLV